MATREYHNAWYAKNQEKRRSQLAGYAGKARRRNQDFVCEFLLAHPCIDCGESDIVVLEFDHQGNKDIAVAVALQRCWAIERLQAEIEKCEVRCANCHRRKTAKERDHYRVKFHNK